MELVESGMTKAQNTRAYLTRTTATIKSNQFSI